MENLVGRQVGQYEIESLIGRGGMATVYRARQLSVERDVAIKVITERYEPESPFMQRFMQEVRIIARLENPHILPIYDFGHIDQHPYLVMRYLDGGSLNGLINRRRLELQEIERLIIQICAALDYAHEQNVVHRDMKPHNVLLDRQGNAYICDFGIAKIIGGDHALTRTGEAVGTPSYMAPEQWQGLSVDRQADVYAVGAMLYEMLTGDVPFESDNIFSLMYKHLNEMPPRIAPRRPELPPALDMVIAQAMAKLPADRFASAGEMARAVSLALRGPTIPQGRAAPETRRLRTPGADEMAETDVIGLTRDDDLDVRRDIGLDAPVAAGRAWALNAFLEWLDDPDASPILFIVGPHGIGKSTLASRFADHIGRRVLRYELVAEESDTLEPHTFVESLAAQVVSLAHDANAATAADVLREAIPDPVAAFERRVLDPLGAEDQPVYLVLDGLEAAFERTGLTIADVMRVALENWPGALRMIVTGTPHPGVELLLRRARRLELDPESDENRADLRSTLSTRFATLVPNLSQGEIDLNALLEKSEGNPLYLNTVFDHLVYRRLAPADLADLPAGLDALYSDLTRRAEARDPGAMGLLCTLAAARVPLPDRLLGTILDDAHRGAQARLMALRPLVSAHESAWRLAHAALRYWLIEAQPEAMRAAHRGIAEALLRIAPAQMDDYALSYLPAHLALAGEPLRAAALLLDLNFLAARLARVSPPAVLDDFTTIRQALGSGGADVPDADAGTRAEQLRMVEGAIRQTLPALAASPEGTFAQLYNGLAGLPALADVLRESAARRRAPWLRLVWPVMTSGQHAPEIIWQGATPLALSAASTGGRWLAACGDGYLRIWADGTLIREWPAGREQGTAVLTTCALSADGRLALSGAEDGSARLWTPDDGKWRQELADHRGAVTGCALNADGSRALTTAGRLLQMWDCRSGGLLQAFYEHPEPVRCCAFAAGDRLALSGSSDGLLRVWDSADGTLRWTLSGHRGAVTACAGSPPGFEPPVALSGATDGTVRVWDIQSGTLLRTLSGASAPITALAVRQCGVQMLVVAAAEDRTIRVWDVMRGEVLARFDGHRKAPVSCALLPDGRILSGGLDGVLYRWEMPAPGAAPQAERHGAEVRACVFSSDSARLLTASLDRDLRVWDAGDGRSLVTLRGHTGGVAACALRADDRAALSASSDRTARIWDVSRGSLTRLLTGHGEAVTTCAFSPRPLRSGAMKRAAWLAATGGADRTVRVWETEGGEAILTLRGHHDEVIVCAFSPDGETLLTTSRDRTARLWSLDAGEAAQIIESDAGIFLAAAFSGDGRWLLLGLESGHLWRMDRRSGQIDPVDIGARGAITACGFNRSGRLIFGASADGSVRIWNADRGQIHAVFQAPRPLTCGALAPDDITLAAGDDRGHVFVLRLEGPPGARRKTNLL